MKTPIFSGIATALITPFREGKIDLMALKKITERQIEKGIDALVVFGTTGESPTLTEREKLLVIESVAETNCGRVPIIAGSGGNDTYRSAMLSSDAVSAGADAILAVCPYYNKPQEEGLYRHFISVAEKASRPIILYNIPGRAGMDLPFSLYERLSSHPLVLGIKEASGSMSLAARISQRFGDSIPLYTGNDELILPTLSVGGLGAISVISNIFPSEMCNVCRYFKEGKITEARELYFSLLPIMQLLFAETNPIPIKSAMAHLGYCLPEIRLPLTEASEETKRTLFREIAKLKL